MYFGVSQVTSWLGMCCVPSKTFATASCTHTVLVVINGPYTFEINGNISLNSLQGFSSQVVQQIQLVPLSQPCDDTMMT